MVERQFMIISGDMWLRLERVLFGMKAENKKPKFHYVSRTIMTHFKVEVKWKNRIVTEEYECTEFMMEEIVKEFKGMKDKPWSVKVFCEGRKV